MNASCRAIWVLVALALTACTGTATPDEQQPTEVRPTSVIPTAAPAEPTSTPEAATVPTSYEAADCPFSVPPGAPVECGFVTVPEDHSNPEGRTIRLAVVIVRDDSANHQPDPVLLLAGGPGEKVVANGLTIAQIFVPTVPDRDLIIYDQRGVGLSEPALECPEWEQSLFDTLDEPDPEISMRTNFEALMACGDRLLEEGHDLSLYNNSQNAADVDALRQALGYEQINIYGGSYGSLLAQLTVRDYPENIRSAVMWSVWPIEKSLMVEGTIATAEAVTRLLESCEADQACHQAYPDLQEVLFEVIDRLNAEQVTLTVTNPLDGASYTASLSGDGVFGNLVALLYQTQLIPALPQAIYDVYGGDYELMGQLIGQNLALYSAMSRGMTYSFVCTDDLIGRSPEEVRELKATLPEQFAGRVDHELITRYGIFSVCENWPVDEADASVKRPLVSDIPILLLEGEFDPVTPPVYAELVAEDLSNSHFFEFPGIGHNILVASECARNMAGAFLDDPQHAPSASCISNDGGIVFDVPGDELALTLQPYVDEQRGFTGLLPVGWRELGPANLLRGDSTLDPTYFVLEAAPLPAGEMLGILASQLEFDPELEPVATRQLGSFEWDFYSFERRSYPADLAMAEAAGTTYFVLMIAAEAEHAELYEQLFLPAVETMAPLG